VFAGLDPIAYRDIFYNLPFFKESLHEENALLKSSIFMTEDPSFSSSLREREFKGKVKAKKVLFKLVSCKNSTNTSSFFYSLE